MMIVRFERKNKIMIKINLVFRINYFLFIFVIIILRNWL
jgi:hypothetical protein